LHWEWTNAPGSPGKPVQEDLKIQASTPSEDKETPVASNIGLLEASSDLLFLYTLKDCLYQDFKPWADIVGEARDLIDEQVQLKEMQEWNI